MVSSDTQCECATEHQMDDHCLPGSRGRSKFDERQTCLATPAGVRSALHDVECNDLAFQL